MMFKLKRPFGASCWQTREKSLHERTECNCVFLCVIFSAWFDGPKQHQCFVLRSFVVIYDEH